VRGADGADVQYTRFFAGDAAPDPTEDIDFLIVTLSGVCVLNGTLSPRTGPAPYVQNEQGLLAGDASRYEASHALTNEVL
jgi:hypothetical protein